MEEELQDPLISDFQRRLKGEDQAGKEKNIEWPDDDQAERQRDKLVREIGKII